MKMSLKTVAIAIAVFILLVIIYKSTTSGYAMSGSPVQTNISDSQFANFFSRMTKLGPELKCNPGSADAKDGHVMSSYYTGGLLPGGYCDDQQVVNAASNYKLVGVEPALGD